MRLNEEVKELLEDMERKCDRSAVLNGAEDSVAQALRDVGELHERARQGVREAICALAIHYDVLGLSRVFSLNLSRRLRRGSF